MQIAFDSDSTTQRSNQILHGDKRFLFSTQVDILESFSDTGEL